MPALQSLGIWDIAVHWETTLHNPLEKKNLSLQSRGNVSNVNVIVVRIKIGRNDWPAFAAYRHTIHKQRLR